MVANAGFIDRLVQPASALRVVRRRADAMGVLLASSGWRKTSAAMMPDWQRQAVEQAKREAYRQAAERALADIRTPASAEPSSVGHVRGGMATRSKDRVAVAPQWAGSLFKLLRVSLQVAMYAVMALVGVAVALWTLIVLS
jgi:hypothetical protein